MGGLPNVLPGYQSYRDEGVRRKFEQAWGRPLPTGDGLTVVEMMEAASRGRVRGMYIMGENPMLSDPDLGHVEEALRSLEFLAVQDIFLTETARLAHVVLPAAAFAEKEGTFTNTERRVQLLRRAVPPPGEALADWEIICRLAERMGYPMAYAGPGEIMDEITRLVPSYGGMGYAYLGEGGKQWPCPHPGHPGTPILHRDKFTRGRARLFPLKFRPPAEVPDAEYPLYLTTGRILFHYHTGSMTRRSRGLEAIRPYPYVEIHPDTAAGLGIADGQVVEVASRRGAIRLRALVTDRTAPQVVFIPFHYAEAAANVLTNPALDPQARIPELKVCAVRVRPV
jgi:predicted molibdopterin-dependent oxidoreductase YjgC